MYIIFLLNILNYLNFFSLTTLIEAGANLRSEARLHLLSRNSLSRGLSSGNDKKGRD